jgi:hypothetical protein
MKKMTIVRNDFTTDRLTIIIDDNSVYTDISAYADLDLSQCGIPDDVHALQYWSGDAEIEYKGPVPNDKFTGPENVPEWALLALDKWIERRTADLLLYPNMPR